MVARVGPGFELPPLTSDQDARDHARDDDEEGANILTKVPMIGVDWAEEIEPRALAARCTDEVRSPASLAAAVILSSR